MPFLYARSHRSRSRSLRRRIRLVQPQVTDPIPLHPSALRSASTHRLLLFVPSQGRDNCDKITPNSWMRHDIHCECEETTPGRQESHASSPKRHACSPHTGVLSAWHRVQDVCLVLCFPPPHLPQHIGAATAFGSSYDLSPLVLVCITTATATLQTHIPPPTPTLYTPPRKLESWHLKLYLRRVASVDILTGHVVDRETMPAPQLLRHRSALRVIPLAAFVCSAAVA